jgi:predicted acetyltransferase
MMPGTLFRLSEFFVLRKHRRHGFGRRAALALFGQFRGKWQLSVLPGNEPAICFWRTIIDEYPWGLYQEGKNSNDVLYVFATDQER